MSEINELSKAFRAVTGRRGFLKTAGTAGIAVAGAGLLAKDAHAQRGALDPQVLNFALNLEYLEAEYYTLAVSGTTIDNPGGATGGPSFTAVGITGTSNNGNTGVVTRKTTDTRVNFTSNPLIGQYAAEIAADERAHVNFLRTALAGSQVARPNIDLLTSFNNAAQAAGIGATFDPFADPISFLIGAFVFEDVGVTAYKGAARLLSNKDYLEAAAGILAVEAYHAGSVRSTLLAIAAANPSSTIVSTVNKISDLRDGADGASDDDQGITDASGNANIVPTDADALAYSRNTTQVLNIVYLSGTTTPGGFFPNGLNGGIR